MSGELVSRPIDLSPNSSVDVDNADQSETRQIRKRRHHAKSRLGCIACRRRRVKCDQERPRCGNCQRREDACSLGSLAPASRSRTLQPHRPMIEPGLGNGLHAHLSMLQMKLLHHFDNSTAETLIFGESIWRSFVIPLAFEHEFLMHAVLLISAKHLGFLNPSDATYRSASLLHLSETLRLFRHALVQPVTRSNGDAFIATSTLLVHYAWATVDSVVTPQDDSLAVPPNLNLDLSLDPLFTLSLGLRNVFMNSWRFIHNSESIFATSAIHRPRECLEKATFGRSQASDELEILISKAYCKHRAMSENPIVVCPKPAPSDSTLRSCLDLRTGHEMAFAGERCLNEEAEEDFEMLGFLDATSRLTLILGLCQQQPVVADGALPTDQHTAHRPKHLAANVDGVESGFSPPLSDVARYIFSFPTRSVDSFIGLAKIHHPCALLVLYLFYRAVDLLLPEQQCWWSRRRAQVVGSAIERVLLAQGDEDSDMILQEGQRIVESSAAGTVSAQNTAVRVQTPRTVDSWDEVWERTRCVLEKFGWRKGPWYPIEQAMNPQGVQSRDI